LIALIDYGLGNIQAFANIYKRLGVPFCFARSVGDLAGASHMILPGVGSFDWAMERLQDAGMREALDHLVLEEKKPVLGVCVGMQIMAHRSEEGNSAGLGWLQAEVKHFDESQFHHQTHLPHMGWNDVVSTEVSGLFEGLCDGARFYFLHSYYFSPKSFSDVAALSEYGSSFACAVKHENIYGVQFHPEKSHRWGIQLLKNFSKL